MALAVKLYESTDREPMSSFSRLQRFNVSRSTRHIVRKSPPERAGADSSRERVLEGEDVWRVSPFLYRFGN